MENLFKQKNSEINVSEILGHISDGEKKIFLKEGINSDWKLMFNYKPTEEEDTLINKTLNYSEDDILKMKEISSELDFEGRIVATSSNAHTKLSYKQKNETEYKIIKL